MFIRGLVAVDPKTRGLVLDSSDGRCAMSYPKSHLGKVVLLSVAIAFIACEPAAEAPEPEEKPSMEADVEAIDELREQGVAAINGKDVEAYLALVTDDAVLMPPHESPAVGKEAIRSKFQALLDPFTPEVTASSEEVVVAGDWAFERYSFNLKLTPTEAGEPIEDSGQGVQIYRRQADGSWKIAYDIWNSNKPLVVGTGEP